MTHKSMRAFEAGTCDCAECKAPKRDPRKQAILNALRAFAEQRPGLDPYNYFSNGADARGRAAYRSESRRITQALADARQLLAYVSGQDAITADMILNADPGGRLTIEYGKVTVAGEVQPQVSYCTGQYFPTEYRRAVCRLLSLVLWSYVRDHGMPPAFEVYGNPPGTKWHAWDGCPSLVGFRKSVSRPVPVSAGDWLRAHFKREFGRRIASRYFD